MKFFCPRCQTPIAAEGETAQVRCTGCGLNVNLALLATSAGRPTLPVILDHTAERIGPYQLEEALGSGGMGTVYRATDTRDGRTVAIKLLFPQLCALEPLVERFQREARALQALDHPRIVRYIEEGELDGQRYLVMEYVSGDNLEQHLKQHKPGPDQVLQIGIQIAEALAAAHARGIVHRDLKPANILWSKDGVRVLDFGIAQMATEDLTLTHSDSVLGTVNYMAPEQRQRSHLVDHRADLYSLGVLLYYLLTGQLPLGAFQPPSKLNRRVNPRLDRLVSRALQNDPERRFQSAQEMTASMRLLQTLATPRRQWLGGLVLVVGLGAGGWMGANGPEPEAVLPPPEVLATVEPLQQKIQEPALLANQLGQNAVPAQKEPVQGPEAKQALDPITPQPKDNIAKQGDQEAPPRIKEPVAQPAVKKPTGAVGTSYRDKPVVPTGKKKIEQAQKEPLPAEPSKAAADEPAPPKGESKQAVEQNSSSLQPQAAQQAPPEKAPVKPSKPYYPLTKGKVRIITVPSDGVPLYSSTNEKEKPIATLPKGAELMQMGTVYGPHKDRWLRVRTESGEEGLVPARLLQNSK